MDFGLRTTGSFDKTQAFLDRIIRGNIFAELDKYGRLGVEALAHSTPINTGKTASSWAYRVTKGSRQSKIEWYNTNNPYGENVAVLIQYGHGTRNGGYVTGRDYINPAMRPIFDDIANNLWKEVTR